MAVFTPVSADEAAAFLTGYDVGDLHSLTPIAEGVENTNYRLVAGDRTFVLTLFEKRVRPEDIPFYLDLTNHLADRGVPAPRPVRTLGGDVVGALCERPAAMIEWLEGRPKPTPSLADYGAAGAMLAQIHETAADFPQQLANPFGPARWRRILDECASAPDAGRFGALISSLELELAHLARAWPQALPATTIHGDYFPDNVFFIDDAVSGVIDYYFACTDWRAYDLAIAVNAWAFTPDGRYLPEAAAALTQGYARATPLTAEERAGFALLCRAGAVRFTVTRLHDQLFHDPAWVMTPKDPDAFHNRLEVHRRLDAAEAYGL